MDYFAALDEAENIGKQKVRSAVVLAKIRYDEQLAPFVRTSKVRLESSLVQSEISRIVAEVSHETNADADKVGSVFRRILADAVAVTEPERTSLENAKTFGAPDEGKGSTPEGGDTKEESPLPGVARTDILDSKAVLEDEILEADAQIDITKPLTKGSCVRCKTEIENDSPVCQVCNDTLVAMAKKKEALAPNPQMPAAQPQQQMAPTHLMPLNPNAPYQCTVCGRTGTWDEVNNHLSTAQDVPHIQAIQRLRAQDAQAGQMQPQQPQQTGQMAPQQAPAYHASFKEQDEIVKAAGEYEIQQDQDAAVEDEHPETPSSHFDNIVKQMANRAAARHFSAPTDNDISQIATTYGLDPGEIKQSIKGAANFGNYHAVNGTISNEDPNPPQGYTEVDLNNGGNGIQSQEAVVPVNIAIKKVSDDLGMDPNNVYSAVKEAFGGDLSDEYHISVQGEYHFYLPQQLMAKATQHPQPPTPDQQQQPQPGQQPMQAQPNMGMPQPDQSQMPQFASSVLNEKQLEVLLTRDKKLADQRQLMRK